MEHDNTLDNTNIQTVSPKQVRSCLIWGVLSFAFSFYLPVLIFGIDIGIGILDSLKVVFGPIGSYILSLVAINKAKKIKKQGFQAQSLQLQLSFQL